ncbi:Peptidyl-prolyl cis-trans isomerase [Melia azedarach]|uniref:Peptidyl-prolyl cis-trans isomerase n=1 Tax=Melia azedarach TaxID=155640 RepID=A0ACC1X4F7_MELAZ|nr:Peptidyl-prolyl cis-trans isomerase [Melia azedarach]
MSVLMVTSLGDLVVDLFVEKCPLTAKNFLKLCKIKYYNGCLFHTVQKDFTAQTGDPTGTGTGGDSVYKYLYGEQARFFSDEIRVDLKHTKTGTVAMASAGENLNASQFYITLRDNLDYLDEKHTIFGEVAEGFDTLSRINEAYVDEKNRPYKNIRIKHTYVLEDPFDDPSQLAELIPDASPEGKPKDEVDDEVRLEDDWVPLDEQLSAAELEEVLRAKDAHSSAVVLESIGDIPDADIKPPENVLFVCKLNPVTEDEDLHTIFSRFGTVVSAEVIRDYKTGDSLCYAFIEFKKQEACEQAYFKMDNALIDDRRIHVDFSQSVSKLWNQYRRKANQTSKGNGCFKCGAPDHIAKDCTGQQAPKYTLKDDNRQRGGYSDSRYEMVFDEDAPENPMHEKKDRGLYADDRVERTKMNRQSSDVRDRDQERRDLGNRHRDSDRMRESRQENRDRHGGSRRDQERHVQRQEVRDDNGRHKLDYRKSLEPVRCRERREDGDYRKRSAEIDNCAERKDNGDHRKRSSENDSRRDRRDDGDHRKRSSYGDIHGDRKDERDYWKNSAHSDRRDTRKEISYRKGSEDDDSHGRRGEEREKRRRDAESDEDHDRDRRHHQGDKRR